MRHTYKMLVSKTRYSMIQLDPKERLSCQSYQQKSETLMLPTYFSILLHKFFSDIVPLGSDARVHKTHEIFLRMHEMMISGLTSEHIQVSAEKGIGGQAINSPRESREKLQQIVLDNSTL